MRKIRFDLSCIDPVTCDMYSKIFQRVQNRYKSVHSEITIISVKMDVCDKLKCQYNPNVITKGEVVVNDVTQLQVLDRGHKYYLSPVIGTGEGGGGCTKTIVFTIVRFLTGVYRDVLAPTLILIYVGSFLCMLS